MKEFQRTSYLLRGILWLAVSGEALSQLRARSWAKAILTTCTAVIYLGAISYGLDDPSLLAWGSLIIVLLLPVLAKSTAQGEEPLLLLSHLAVRVVAKRYAALYFLKENRIIRVMKAEVKSLEAAGSEAGPSARLNSKGFESTRPVWVVLMDKAVLFLSEGPGGAKLERIFFLSHEATIRPASISEEIRGRAIILENTKSKSNAPGVLVFAEHEESLRAFENDAQAALKRASDELESFKRLTRGLR